MFTGSAHHNWFHGSVGIIDPDKGFNFPHGLTKVTADVMWPESGNGPVDPIESPMYHASGNYGAYYSPYPLSETDFLVSANRGGKFVLYFMDVYGNRELIYEGSNHVFTQFRSSPVPGARLFDRAVFLTCGRAPNRKTHSFTAPMSYTVPRGTRDKARYLRILNIDPKTYTYWHKRPLLSTGPVVSVVQSEGVKRILGTVPVESDGSVSFAAPAGMALHFQLLDEHYRALHSMRSFVNVMPGKSRGCLGCHELHSKAPGVSKPQPRIDTRAQRDHAAAVGTRHRKLPPLRAARTGSILREVPRGRRQGPRGLRHDRAPEFTHFHRAIPDHDWPALMGRPVRSARKSPARLGHRRSAHGRSV